MINQLFPVIFAFISLMIAIGALCLYLYYVNKECSDSSKNTIIKYGGQKTQEVNKMPDKPLLLPAPDKKQLYQADSFYVIIDYSKILLSLTDDIFFLGDHDKYIYKVDSVEKYEEKVVKKPDGSAEMARLLKENRHLKKENEALKKIILHIQNNKR